MKTFKKHITDIMTASVLLSALLLGLTACGSDSGNDHVIFGTQKDTEQSSGSAETLGSENKTEDADNDQVKEDLKGAVKIKTADDLLDFAKEVNAGNTTLNAVLTADIDMTPICGEGIGSWEAISKWDGIFDGGGYTITGLYSVEEENKIVGALFKNAGKNSIIRNLVMKDAVIGVSGGCLAGTSEGLIENCHVTGTVSGHQVGGLAGTAHIIKDCTFAGTVEGSDAAGGLAWRVDQAVNCRNEARVICLNEQRAGVKGTAAGIAVKALGDVIGCTNAGTIISADAAGIVAHVNYDTDKPKEIKIEDCKNTGTVIGRTQAGGIGSFLGNKTLINRCGNEGTLYAGGAAGGIAVVSRFQILNSFQKGLIEVGFDQVNQRLAEEGLSEFATLDVEAPVQVQAAGIVYGGNQVINCYSQGSISAQHIKSSYGDAMGIMQFLNADAPCVANCYSTAVLNGTHEELGIGELYKNAAESSFYSEQTAERASNSDDSDFAPTAAGSFTDDTVTNALNGWVSSAGGDYSSWKQGKDGPCFDWE